LFRTFRDALPANVIRAKGFVASRMARSFLISWRAVGTSNRFESARTELVFIGKKITAEKSGDSPRAG